MIEEKKQPGEVEVRDLRPSKDAKGGRRQGRHLGRRRGGNQNNAGTDSTGSGAGKWDY